MKNLAKTLGAVAACWLLASAPTAAADRGGSPTTNAGQVQFGLDLLGKTARGRANGAISPASAAATLAILAQGGDAIAQKGIAETARLRTLGELTQFGRALADLNQGTGDPAVVIGAANGVWFDNSANVQTTFARAVQDRLAADLQRADLGSAVGVAAVNAWVSQRTKGQIPALLGTPMAKPAMIALNAFHFDGKWTAPFDAERTRPRPFTRADGRADPVPMMDLGDATLAYREFAKARAVDLTYGNGRFHLTMVLPPDRRRDPLTWALSNRKVAAPLLQGRDFSQRLVAFSMPRLRLETTADLLDALKALGMGKALLRPESFAGIATPPPSLGRVVQKTAVTMNEEGTRAAAATAAIMDRSIAFVDKVQLRLDRPFLFALRDNQLGAVLLLGVVRDPTQ